MMFPYLFSPLKLGTVEVKKAENDNRQKSLDASIPEGIESRYDYDRKQLEKKITEVRASAPPATASPAGPGSPRAGC